MRRLGPLMLIGFLLGILYMFLNTEKSPFLPMFNNDGENISMKITVFYTSCCHEETVNRSLSKNEWEQMLATLKKDGWELKRSSIGEVELNKELLELCTGCKKQEFIGIYQDEIGVYAGTPKKPGPLKQVIPVKIAQLPEEEVNDLREGIVCQETRDKLLMIEGYQN